MNGSGRKSTLYICAGVFKQGTALQENKLCVKSGVLLHMVKQRQVHGGYMSKKEEYEQKTEKLLEPIIQKNNFELVDVEYVKEGGNWYLRAYIDKEGGITVDDCEIVNRVLSDLLDEHDYIPESYILEVSSPGLGRQLKKEKDYARSINKEVEIKLYKPINKQKEIIGFLTGYDAVNFTIQLEDESTMDIPRADVALIRLAFDF
jgi:ribosome maturation factor RimP